MEKKALRNKKKGFKGGSAEVPNIGTNEAQEGNSATIEAISPSTSTFDNKTLENIRLDLIKFKERIGYIAAPKISLILKKKYE